MYATRITRRTISAAITAVGLTTAALVAAGPASAATANSITFNYSPDYQHFTVPAGITSVYLDVTGGSGANGQGAYGGGSGGSGAEVTGTLAVTPGQVLTVWAGGAGQSGGGAGYGNPSHTDFMGGAGGSGYGAGTGAGGGGGAASYVMSGSTVVAVGGGGGGGGGSGGLPSPDTSGGAGGTGGHDTSGDAFPGGTDGAGTDGGRGGFADDTNSDNGANGQSYSNNGTFGGGGGGGGGGYYHCPSGYCMSGGGGGEAGIYSYGGGGGSGGNSYADSSLQNPAYAVSNLSASTAGHVTITWGLPQSTTSVTAGTASARDSVRLVAFVSPSDGGGTVDFQSDGSAIPGCSGLPLDTGGGTDWATSCTTSSLGVGSHTITANYSGDAGYSPSSGSATETINLVQTSTSITASRTKVATGTPVTFTATVASSDGTGTVSFNQGGTPLTGCGSVSLTATANGEVAKCVQKFANSAAYFISATYSGDPTSTTSSAQTRVDVFPPLIANPQTLPQGTVGQAYSATLTASNVNGEDALAWWKGAGSLPDGLHLTSAGVITGKPIRAQTATFTAWVRDTGTTLTAHADYTITVGGGSSAPVIIQAVRFAGPGGGSDDYVELYNAGSSAVHLLGWQLQYPGNAVNLPNTVLAPHGNYLIAGAGYSLGNLEPADFSPAGLDLSAGGGVRIVAPDASVTDAVGTTAADPGYWEGAGLPVPTQNGTQIGFERRIVAGSPSDTNDNAADFLLVAPDGDTTDHSAAAVVGAPSPTGSTGRVRAWWVRTTLLDPTQRPGANPNYSYDPSTHTLIIRRTLTNISTNRTASAVWLRINTIPTYGTATANQALLTLQSASDENVDGKYVVGAGLDPVPSQPDGGGIGSLAAVNVGTGLAPGQSINVELAFHVMRTGATSIGFVPEAYSAQ